MATEFLLKFGQSVDQKLSALCPQKTLNYIRRWNMTCIRRRRHRQVKGDKQQSLVRPKQLLLGVSTRIVPIAVDRHPQPPDNWLKLHLAQYAAISSRQLNIARLTQRRPSAGRKQLRYRHNFSGGLRKYYISSLRLQCAYSARSAALSFIGQNRQQNGDMQVGCLQLV